MGGGLMQLVAYGAQDIYLTGNPQITFFKVVYRRHTNFAIESIRQTLNGNTVKGSESKCIIGRDGDLIHKIWIGQKTKSNPVGPTGSHIYKYIDQTEIRIGGQLMDRQTSDWNNIWWELTTPESKINGYRDVFRGINYNYSNSQDYNYFWYPLNYWFCRNIGLALPLIALQYHEITLDIKWSENSIVDNPEVWIDYIFLDTDERRKFAQIQHEYLIEQIQYQDSPGNIKNIDLNFNHPIKELIWVNYFKHENNDITFSYGPIGVNSSITSDIQDKDNFLDAEKTSCELKLNGHDRFRNRNVKYFRTLQPLTYHTRCPSYSKELSETIYINNASINSSGIPIFKVSETIALKRIEYIGKSDVSSQIKLKYCINENFDPTDFYNSASLTLIENMDTFNDTFKKGHKLLDTSDSRIIQTDRHLYITSDIDSTITCNIKIIYETLPYLFSSTTVKQLAFIYCYSFSLNPEEHQPSGTCNFSRIDKKQLEFKNTPGGSDTTIKIFAVNYNILRINSGMGAIAYSN